MTDVRILSRHDPLADQLSEAEVYVGEELCGQLPEIASEESGEYFDVKCDKPIRSEGMNTITVTSTRSDALGFHYIEAYGTDEREFSHEITDGGSSNPDVCFGLARTAGFQYATVNDGKCYAGNSYGAHGQAQGGCTKCEGSDFTCGSDTTNSVYDLNPPAEEQAATAKPEP